MTKRTCKIAECDKTVHARGMCARHYNADRLARITAQCSVDGCMETSVSAGMCRSHYYLHRQESAERCSVEGCDSAKHANGLCQRHDRQRRQSESTETCSIDGCSRPISARKMCSAHYLRWWKYGDPAQSEVHYDDPERQFTDSYVVADNGCWEWVRWVERNGYARFTENGRRTGAHRWSYEHFVGPIPEGLQIDHLCSNRKCVNPDHLEPVTAAENLRRARERKEER